MLGKIYGTVSHHSQLSRSVADEHCSSVLYLWDANVPITRRSPAFSSPPHRLRILCEHVAALGGPGLQDEYVAAHINEHADGLQSAVDHPHLRMVVVDVLVYVQVSPCNIVHCICNTDTPVGR